jgi:undecaprenyl-diphosphatase
MHFIDSFILGAVEGITEFLPISSTAHMILVSKILGLAQSDFLKSFEIVIQLGAILAVVVMFWKKIFYFQVLKKVIIGFIPTAVLGLLLYKRVKEYLGDVSVVLWALLVGGIIIVLFEKWHKSRAGGAGAALSPLAASILAFSNRSHLYLASQGLERR